MGVTPKRGYVHVDISNWTSVHIVITTKPVKYMNLLYQNLLLPRSVLKAPL